MSLPGIGALVKATIIATDKGLPLDLLVFMKKQGSECTIGPVHVEPQVILPADRSNFRERIHRTCAHRACCPYDEERQITRLDICPNGVEQDSSIHAQLSIRGNPGVRLT